MQIVSLVPSQTELLYDLGLRDEVIGITKFCVHPAEWFRSKTRIGGTKNIDIKKIHGLEPDLIIANKEENVKEQIEKLKKYFHVYVSDVKNLDDALKMINVVGELVNKKQKAVKLIEEIENKFEKFKVQNSKFKVASVLYLIWKNPYMTIGNDTFIHNMISRCGFKNIFYDLKRYPEITNEQIKMEKPDLIFLATEPFPFKKKHIDDLKITCPAAKIFLVNGEYFSWYGSRLLQAPAYFQKLIAEIHST